MRGRLALLAKAAAAFLILFLLALAAAPFLLKRYFPPEKVRALVVSNARKALKREVSLGGVSWSLLKGLTLDELAVSESPDFKAGEFAAVRSFNLRIRWLPLLQRKLVVDRVSAEGLRLSVVRRANGLYNFSDIAGSTAAAKSAPPPAGGLPLELDVSRASVSGGQVAYRDAGSGDRLTVTELDAAVRDFRLDRPFDAELSLKASGKVSGRPLDGSLVFAGRVDLGGNDQKRMGVEIRKLSAEYGGFRVQASGSVTGLAEPKAELKFALAAKAGPLVEGEFSGSPAQGAFKARTAGFGSGDLETVAALKPLKLPAGLAVPALQASGRFDYKDDIVVLKSLHVESKAGTMDVSGSVSKLSSAKPEPDLKVKAAIELPELKAADVPFAKLPAGLVLPAAAVSVEVRLQGDGALIDGLHVKTKAGTINVSGTVSKLSSARPEPDLEVGAKLDLPEIKASVVPFAKLPEGFVSPAASVEGKVRLRGDDLQVSALRVRTRAGTVDLTGTVKGVTSGKPEPDLDVVAKVSLPALTSKDIPSSAVPPGLQIPPSQWDAALSASLDEVKVTALRVVVGKNDLEVSGKAVGLRSRKPVAALLLKCRSFVLEELTQLSPQTRDLKLAGSGFFALGVTGRPDKPVLEGKLQFRGLGATVGGLKLSDFTGTAKFDERRIDVPRLKGKVEEGDLEMDLTVKDYSTDEPDIDVVASLTQFDLGKFMAAKAALAKSPEAKKEESRLSLSARRRFAVGRLIHPNAEARDVEVVWELTGITPDLKRIGGSAKLYSKGGKFTSLGKMATQSKVVKVLLLPFMIFQKIGSIGGIRLFPDFNDVSYTELAGDYAFKDGVMTLQDSHLYSGAGNVTARGTIDLPAERLDLTVTAQVGHVAPIDVEVKGTFSEPKTKVKMGKFLAEPAKQLLDGILRR